MSLISDLRAFLVADTDLAALVGQRVHHQAVPESSHLPAVVFWRVSTAPQNRLAGVSGVHRMRWQFGARANTALKAEEVADALVARLENHTGPTGSSEVQHILYEARFDGWDPQLESYADDVDVIVWARP